MYIDTAAFCGHWPYYHLREGALAQVLENLRAAGIEGGLMSSLDAVFYNDPWEADGPLAEALKQTPWRVAMSINPTMPWAKELVQQGRAAGVGAVRLYPCIHGYQEDEACVVELCRLAGQLDLPVILTMRMEDERMAYLLKQDDPDCARIRSLTQQCGNTKFILSNCLVHQVEQLLPLPENVWFDTAGFKAEFYLETQQHIPAGRILFGSFAPLQAVNSALLSVPEPMKKRIMQENAKELYK